MHCRPLPLPPSQWGSGMQLWTSNLALILLTVAVSVDYSQGLISEISGESQQTQALQGMLTVLFLAK